MAKPIEPLPVLRGKTAREFEKRFLTPSSQPDPEKAEQHKKDMEVYQRTKVIR